MHCGKQNQDYPRLLQRMPTLFHSPQALGQPPVKLETALNLLFVKVAMQGAEQSCLF